MPDSIVSRANLGAERTEQLMVDEARTARAMGSGTLPVLATPALVALMEKAAASLLGTMLPDGMTSVGIRMDVAHIAATPVGMAARATATVLAIDGRKVTFDIAARDERGEIGRATHERFVVDSARFLARAESKLAR